MKTISTLEVKDKLSEVIASAENGEPQIITRNGKETAVVISYREFQRLTAKKETLSEFLLNSPLRESGIDLTRSKDTGRETIDFNSEEYL